RAMEVVYSEDELRAYMGAAVSVSNDSPVLLDHFLDSAVEVDVDVVSDGKNITIGAIMEHIEQAGVHSGDSACSLPPNTLDPSVQEQLRDQVRKLARGLDVVGLMNTQFAIQGKEIYLLEVNPRASRTVPFVSKATGRPLAKIAALCMAGKTLAEQGIGSEPTPDYFSVKVSVFPFARFPGADPILGPEMKSTGEVMGTGRFFGEAYAKAQLASGSVLPTSGTAFISVRDRDKEGAIVLARILRDRGFEILATEGTAVALETAGVDCVRVNKVREGRPHVVDMIKNDEISLIVNTTEGRQAIRESESIRREAVHRKVTYYTTIAAARATCVALEYIDVADVHRLADLHEELVA
ncbi:MAG: carbamoyl-phosphate synthase large subunit, partial [Gammaproteobacteria bacterium]